MNSKMTKYFLSSLLLTYIPRTPPTKVLEDHSKAIIWAYLTMLIIER